MKVSKTPSKSKATTSKNSSQSVVTFNTHKKIEFRDISDADRQNLRIPTYQYLLP
jgi:hypothetical protein